MSVKPGPAILGRRCREGKGPGGPWEAQFLPTGRPEKGCSRSGAQLQGLA